MSAGGIAERLERLLGGAVRAAEQVGGGCISDARRIEVDDGRILFAKLHAPAPSVEAAGLAWLAEGLGADRQGPAGLSVPEVVAVDDDAGIIVLEWVEPGVLGSEGEARLGAGLARLHRAGAPSYGWSRPGVIGTLPQDNSPEPTWAEFYASRRLLPMARAASDAGALPGGGAALVERVAARLDGLAGPAEPPARIHGDLWSGNVLADRSGRPWLVDPAPYGGHREVDLAMLDLFGGLSSRVVAAYDEVAPLAPGWADRVPLWQAWPLLVHAVLFGGGYGAAAVRALSRFA